MYIETFNRIDLAADFCVLYAGEQTCPAGHSYGGIRDHWLMHLVLAGKGQVRAGGQRHAVGPGEAFLFPPGQPHQYTADRQDPWHYVWLGFTGPASRQILAGTAFDQQTLLAPAADPQLAARQFQTLIATLSSGSRSLHSATREQGLAILNGFRSAKLARDPALPDDAPAMGESDPSGMPSASLANVRKLILFFDTNYHRPIGIKQAAAWVHLDRTYCARIFHRHTGTSMHDYLTAIRMQKARQLLLTTDLAIKAVASSVGFMDYPTFAKRFHAENGTTPQGFRALPMSREPRGKPR